MKRSAAVAALVGVAWIAAPSGELLASAGASAASSTSPGASGLAALRPGAASAVVASCHTGTAATDRYAVFSAQMAAVPHSVTMGVRFDVVEVGGAAAGAVAAPGLGEWRRSAAGVAVYGYDQTVAELPYGSYRAVVSFRWLGRAGRVIKRARRQTTLCVQPDTRPALVVGGLSQGQSATPGRSRYEVTVTNRGLSAAVGFGVSLAVDGVAAARVADVANLVAGGRAVLTFDGPSCGAGQSVVVVADPDGRLDLSSRERSTRTFTC